MEALPERQPSCYCSFELVSTDNAVAGAAQFEHEVCETMRSKCRRADKCLFVGELENKMPTKNEELNNDMQKTSTELRHIAVIYRVRTLLKNQEKVKNSTALTAALFDVTSSA
jgi:hypothetical protein